MKLIVIRRKKKNVFKTFENSENLSMQHQISCQYTLLYIIFNHMFKMYSFVYLQILVILIEAYLASETFHHCVYFLVKFSNIFFYLKHNMF